MVNLSVFENGELLLSTNINDYDNNYSFGAVMANGWIGFSGSNESWNNFRQRCSKKTETKH